MQVTYRPIARQASHRACISPWSNLYHFVSQKIHNLACSTHQILSTMNLRDSAVRFELESRKDCREMIRYQCNVCERDIDPEHDGGYLVRLEVYAAQETNAVPIDDDRDHLDEFNEI